MRLEVLILEECGVVKGTVDQRVSSVFPKS